MARFPTLYPLQLTYVTARPASSDAEVTFSLAGHVCSKMRTSMTPETLETLVVLSSDARSEASHAAPSFDYGPAWPTRVEQAVAMLQSSVGHKAFNAAKLAKAKLAAEAAKAEKAAAAGAGAGASAGAVVSGGVPPVATPAAASAEVDEVDDGDLMQDLLTSGVASIDGDGAFVLSGVDLLTRQAGMMGDADGAVEGAAAAGGAAAGAGAAPALAAEGAEDSVADALDRVAAMTLRRSRRIQGLAAAN
jgi:hypothetical protein